MRKTKYFRIRRILRITKAILEMIRLVLEIIKIC